MERKARAGTRGIGRTGQDESAGWGTCETLLVRERGNAALPLPHGVAHDRRVAKAAGRRLRDILRT